MGGEGGRRPALSARLAGLLQLGGDGADRLLLSLHGQVQHLPTPAAPSVARPAADLKRVTRARAGTCATPAPAHEIRSDSDVIPVISLSIDYSPPPPSLFSSAG